MLKAKRPDTDIFFSFGGKKYLLPPHNELARPAITVNLRQDYFKSVNLSQD